MKPAVSSLLLCLFWLFWFVSPVFAVSVVVSDIPTSISASPFSVTVTVTGANSGKNYLRIDLFKDGTSNYFGETYNGNEWYFGSGGTLYFPIDILSSSSTASATVQAQIGEPSATEYSGSGDYKLRVRRYTSASSYSTSGSYDITIDVPTPTVTQTLTPTNTLTPSPTKTPTPASSVTPTKTPTPTHSVTPSPAPVLAVTVNSGSSTAIPEVLGSTEDTDEQIESSESAMFTAKPIIISMLFVSSGLALLAGVFVWQKKFEMITDKT